MHVCVFCLLCAWFQVYPESRYSGVDHCWPVTRFLVYLPLCLRRFSIVPVPGSPVSTWCGSLQRLAPHIHRTAARTTVPRLLLLPSAVCSAAYLVPTLASRLDFRRRCVPERFGGYYPDGGQRAPGVCLLAFLLASLRLGPGVDTTYQERQSVKALRAARGGPLDLEECDMRRPSAILSYYRPEPLGY